MSDVIARQLVTHFRLLRGRGLTLAQVGHELIGNSALTDTVLSETIELDSALSAKDHAKAQLALFASIALLPPRFLLELGAA